MACNLMGSRTIKISLFETMFIWDLLISDLYLIPVHLRPHSFHFPVKVRPVDLKLKPILRHVTALSFALDHIFYDVPPTFLWDLKFCKMTLARSFAKWWVTTQFAFPIFPGEDVIDDATTWLWREKPQTNFGDDITNTSWDTACQSWQPVHI